MLGADGRNKRTTDQLIRSRNKTKSGTFIVPQENRITYITMEPIILNKRFFANWEIYSYEFLTNIFLLLKLFIVYLQIIFLIYTPIIYKYGNLRENLKELI